MGGQVLTALNILMFPTDLPMTMLKEIIKGGQDKVIEAGGVIVGGHTITGEVPVYGLSVTGWLHPEQIITNSKAKPGQILILTKALGTGIVISAKKNDSVNDSVYAAAVESMKQLNKDAAKIMNQYGVSSATDITGFGLLGHALKMALASEVSIKLNAGKLPVIQDVLDLIETGFIPGAAFRNLEFVESDCKFNSGVQYNHKMLIADAQTSGGILMAVEPEKAEFILNDLKKAGYKHSIVIGEVLPKYDKAIFVE